MYQNKRTAGLVIQYAIFINAVLLCPFVMTSKQFTLLSIFTSHTSQLACSILNCMSKSHRCLSISVTFTEFVGSTVAFLSSDPLSDITGASRDLKTFPNY